MGGLFLYSFAPWETDQYILLFHVTCSLHGGKEEASLKFICVALIGTPLSVLFFNFQHHAYCTHVLMVEYLRVCSVRTKFCMPKCRKIPTLSMEFSTQMSKKSALQDENICFTVPARWQWNIFYCL